MAVRCAQHNFVGIASLALRTLRASPGTVEAAEADITPHSRTAGRECLLRRV